jgi:hypothetical protein
VEWLLPCERARVQRLAQFGIQSAPIYNRLTNQFLGSVRHAPALWVSVYGLLTFTGLRVRVRVASRHRWT